MSLPTKRSPSITPLCKRDAVQLAGLLLHWRLMMCCGQVGKRTSTSLNSWRGTGQVSCLLTGPLLLVIGGSDVLFTESAGQKIFLRLCAASGQVQRKTYPGLGHDPVVYGSLKDQTGWIAARFSGESVPNECPRP